jgi:AraC family transcriptional regulator
MGRMDIPNRKFLRVNPVLALIADNLSRPLKATELAKVVHLSRFRFHHLFKEATGESVGQYCNRLRLEKAKVMLASEEAPNLEQIAVSIGMSSSKALAYHFKKRYRVPPSRFRRGISEAREPEQT